MPRVTEYDWPVGPLLSRHVPVFFIFSDGVDYEGSNGTLTITPPTCRGRIRVLISDDTIFEEKETFFFSFSSQDNDRVRVTNTRPFANVTITDSDGEGGGRKEGEREI